MSQQNAVEELLRPFIQLWLLDDERVGWVRPNREGGVEGFDWWPGDFRVQVRASPFHGTDASGRFKITVRTDFLKDIALHSDRVEGMMATIPAPAVWSYAWVYPPRQLSEKPDISNSPRRLWFESSGYIHPHNAGWMTYLLARAGIVQPINAQLHAAGYAELCGTGSPDTTRPSTLRDTDLHLALDVVRQAYVPAGKEASRWIGTGEFEEFTENGARPDLYSGHGDATGMVLETPFGRDRARIQFFTDFEHPQQGHGLLAVLELPCIGDVRSIARVASELNFLETRSWTEFPLLGGWQALLTSRLGPDRGISSVNDAQLAFGLFLPNLLYQPQLTGHVAYWFLERARWAREQRLPVAVNLPIGEIPPRRTGEWEDPG